VCWAHLKRDIRKIAESPGIAGFIGKRLLYTYNKLSIRQNSKIFNKKTPKFSKFLKILVSCNLF